MKTADILQYAKIMKLDGGEGSGIKGHTTERQSNGVGNARGLSDREHELYMHARKEAYGERTNHAEPRNPTHIEDRLMQAIQAFRAGRISSGYDHLEYVDKLSGLENGTSFPRGTV